MHGRAGKATVPIYPHLAGQNAPYLESALKAYRAGERGGGMSMMMTPQAQALSDQDIADIAAYYASLKP
ncbi:MULTISPECIES: c-type cytochrome [Halomonas]|uniref:Cytochrome c n=1 Tax=Halomonas ventosae TaxID=229007 RepID=A0A4R6I2M8_9GAMM|nr:c-type cytochrome [Halomonas ventosae]TDO15228.1 cytochrome c [Halomonas ventosae]